MPDIKAGVKPDIRLDIPLSPESEVRAEPAFSYERVDGTVETADSVEEAIQKCPILSQLPREQAEILMGVTVVHENPISREHNIKTDTVDDAEEPKKNSILSDLLEKSESPKLSQRNTKTPQVSSAEILTGKSSEAIDLQKIARAKIESFAFSVEETVKLIKAKNEPPEARELTVIPFLAKAPKAVMAEVKAEPQESILMPKSSFIEPALPDKTNLQPSSDHISPVPALPPEIPLAVVGQLNEKPARAEYRQDDIIDEVISPTPAEKGLDDSSEPTAYLEKDAYSEAVEVYYDLVAVASDRKGQPDSPTVSLEEEFLDDRMQEEVIFSEYLTVEPKTIAEIKDDANNQSLEEILRDVAVYLYESPDNDKDVDLKNAAQAVVDEISGIDLESLEQANEVVHLNPVLVEKVLNLLRKAGCQEPQEVLIEFIEQNHTPELIKIIHRLHRLSNSQEQQEFMPYLSGATPMALSDEPLFTKLGRAILDAIKIRFQLTETT